MIEATPLVWLLIVGGAWLWLSVAVVAVWCLLHEGARWHREGREAVARDRHTREALARAAADLAPMSDAAIDRVWDRIVAAERGRAL